MTRRPTSTTLDLFRDYQPKPVVARFEAQDVAAWSLAGRMAKAVSITLSESGRTRDEIAAAMSEDLKTKITAAMLNSWASQAKEDHAISAMRLASLVNVTGDIRPLNALLADMGLIAVPQKYEALLRREQAREMKARAEREEQAADAEWRAKR